MVLCTFGVRLGAAGVRPASTPNCLAEALVTTLVTSRRNAEAVAKSASTSDTDRRARDVRISEKDNAFHRCRRPVGEGPSQDIREFNLRDVGRRGTVIVLERQGHLRSMHRPVDLQLAASPSFDGISANPCKSFALLVQIEFLTTARDLPLSHP